MFGPLTLENSRYDTGGLTDIETKCLLCEDSFNLQLRLDIYLKHLFCVHNCVIEDAQNIKNLPEYMKYWRERFSSASVNEIIPSVKIDSTENQYFVFSTLLKEDKELRHKITLEYVLKVQEFERTDRNFIKQCLFCKHQSEGLRKDYLDHLSQQHNLQLGNPQNLVFIDDLINHIEAKLQSLICVFCEGHFSDRNILKEHMRKKLHKRINPENCEYDKFYIVNYLELGKNWRVIEKEDDRYALSIGETENNDEEYSDWNERGDTISCLFCTTTETDINQLCLHMQKTHDFDFTVATKSLDFYQKVKLVNYIRKMIHNKTCPCCENVEKSNVALEVHLRNMQHCKIPDVDVFNQPEFYFPTYENDAFLYLIEDLED
ncbi:zinc finger protein 277 [Sitophilus oryzae]|uniref:Zinc finger protein 277 n=1 Tax=Sitophilus oryzae TaxID=7048 RepID=A0A6J2XVB4_SITOR|nr:zinc finger protein 277 [Sitophilus oryzae]